MKKLFALLTFALLAAMSWAQLGIPGTRVKFDLSSADWKYLQTTKVDANTDVYLYSYKGRLVIDEEGDTVLPYMRIYVKRNCTAPLFDVVTERYMQQPFQPVHESTDYLPTSDGISYVGAYTSPQDGKDYQFRMIYFKDKNTLVEMKLETSRDTFKGFEKKFIEILESVRIEK